MEKNISDILKKFRIQNSLNQEELSKIMNCNISTIRKIEGKKYTVGKKLLYAIYNIKNLEKDDKKYIKTLIDYKEQINKSTKSKEGTAIFELLSIIDNLKKENEYLMNHRVLEKTNLNKAKEFFKVNSFQNDYETTNRI